MSIEYDGDALRQESTNVWPSAPFVDEKQTSATFNLGPTVLNMTVLRHIPLVIYYRFS